MNNNVPSRIAADILSDLCNKAVEVLDQTGIKNPDKRMDFIERFMSKHDYMTDEIMEQDGDTVVSLDQLEGVNVIAERQDRDEHNVRTVIPNTKVMPYTNMANNRIN